MLLKKTNIENELKKLKTKELDSEILLIEQVYEILNKDLETQKTIKKNDGKVKIEKENNFDFTYLETDKIYHLSQIKKICVDYRLRFLNVKYFKGEIPLAAVQKIKSIEKQHRIELKGLKIVAPSKLFKLKDKDDPILFAPIGNGYFYLVHKWGNDLHPFRKLIMWPFKNVVNLAVLVLLISLISTLLIPNGLFSKTSSNAQFWIIYFFVFKSIAAVVIFYGFAMGKNFNPAIWNSKYFNA